MAVDPYVERVEVETSRDVAMLHEIVRAVSSTLDLDAVLRGIVDLLSRAVGCHACYVFLVDDDGRMVVRACSAQYAHHVGVAALEPGEGIAGWVARHREPVFISEGAMLDPRMKAFPEFEEDKYQAVVSVPLVARAGSVLGVIALHAAAPHEYTQADTQFLLSSAALIARAIENAQLHRDTARRAYLFERLFELTQVVASAEAVSPLLTEVTTRIAALINASSCLLYLLEPDGAHLRLRAAAPQGSGPVMIGLTDVGLALRSGIPRSEVRIGTDEGPSLHVPLVISGELVGLLIARAGSGRRFRDEERDVIAAIVAQTSVAVRRLQLVERLAARNQIHDFLNDLAAGAGGGALEARARRLRVDLTLPRVVVEIASVGSEPDSDWTVMVESRLAAAFRGALIERSELAIRALLPSSSESETIARLRAIHREVSLPIAIGVSSRCSTAGCYADAFIEAAQALSGAALVGNDVAVVGYNDLGPYRYLLRLAADCTSRDPQRDRLRALVDYDREHRAQLFKTLEEYLRQRGRNAATAATLYVHPNTLRQRLARIEALTGLDLEREDHLSLELAAKLLRIEALDR